jgi:hypothetical protein
MTERKVTIRVEVLLYVLLVVVATWMHLAKLDWPPLNDAEATRALSSLQGTSDEAVLWTDEGASPYASPAYQLLTRIVFQTVGHGDAAARIVPALFGIALVFIPLLFRRQLGSGRALATAWLLGLSPTLLAASRTASGTTMAAFGILIAVGLAVSQDIKSRGVWIAIALGLTLSTGAQAITALISLGIAAIVAHFQEGSDEPEMSDEEPGKGSSRMLWLIPLVALAIAAGFGFNLRGISSLFDSISTWVTGWIGAGEVSQLSLWTMLLVYEPLILLLGIGGAVIIWRRQENWGFAAISWAAVAMVLASFYSARQPSDIIWAVIPLTLLAGDALARLLEQWIETRLDIALLALASMILIVVTFGYLQLSAYSIGSFINPISAGGILLFILASIALLIAGVLLFGLGWSWGLAWRGASLTIFVVLLVMTLSTGFQLAFTDSAASGRELWRPQSSTVGLPMLVGTLENLSVAQTGHKDFLELEVGPEITPGLAWALRDFDEARRLEAYDRVGAPVVLVPEYAAIPGLTDEYAAQIIVIAERWGWTGALPPDMIAWWIRRDAPALAERWLLFVDPGTFGLDDLLE